MSILATATRSVTARRYFLGAVLAWVLVVYLATASSTQAPLPRSAAGHGTGPVALGAPPVTEPALELAPPDTIPPEPPVLSPIALPAFSSPPPPTTQSLSCPYPTPQAPDPGASPGVILSFLSPLFALGGPYASYAVPTLGAIGPLVPVVTPLVVISEPVLNEITPNMSTVITDVATIEQQAGADGPQSQQFAQEFEPYWLTLLNSLVPAEQAVTGSSAGQCLILFENALARQSQQLNISLPPLPLVGAGIPPSGSPVSSAAVATATTSSTAKPMAQLVLPWSGGIPSSLAATLSTLRARGQAVVVELVDTPPAGRAMGTTGFADFVAQAVHGLPGVNAFAVDGASAATTAGPALADLVHGLAAADAARKPGQLIGLGVPPTALGAAAPGFWRAFATAMRGYQSQMVDFVAAPLTTGPSASLAAATAAAASSARALAAAWTADGGLPARLPLFAAVDYAGPLPATPASITRALRAYQAALAGLRVQVLGMRSAG